MATIGTFKQDGDRFRGTIRTLTLNFEAEFRPSPKEQDKSPDFRILGPHGEFGAAWRRRSAQERDYLSCKLDDPTFSAPVYCSLHASDDGKAYVLIWTR